jgi:hypothetical protein
MKSLKDIRTKKSLLKVLNDIIVGLEAEWKETRWPLMEV